MNAQHFGIASFLHVSPLSRRARQTRVYRLEGYVSAIIQYLIPVAILIIPNVLYAGDLTHVGAQVDDLVTLQVISGARNGCGPAKFDVFRVLLDGTSPADPFRVPEGRALVITELDWYYV